MDAIVRGKSATPSHHSSALPPSNYLPRDDRGGANDGNAEDELTVLESSYISTIIRNAQASGVQVKVVP